MDGTGKNNLMSLPVIMVAYQMGCKEQRSKGKSILSKKTTMSFFQGIIGFTAFIQVLGCMSASLDFEEVVNDRNLQFAPQALTLSDCNANTIATLKSCVSGIANYNGIVLTGNITCNSVADCCGPSSTALIDLSTTIGKFVRGNVAGSRTRYIKRSMGQGTCSLLKVGTNMTVRDFTIDEDSADLACTHDLRCPPTVEILKSGVIVQNVKIAHAKDSAITVYNTTNFTLTGSEIDNGGIVGVILSHVVGPVSITNNRFVNTNTNALYTDQISGSAYNVVVSYNNFTNNHRFGKFPACTSSGTAICGGGQVLLMRGNNINFHHNTIQDGFCTNCVPGIYGYENGVFGIEIGNGSGYLLSNSKIEYNTIVNNSAQAIFSTPPNGEQGMTQPSSLYIRYNNAYNNWNFLTGGKDTFAVPGATQTSNDIKDRDKSFGAESGSWSGDWSVWNNCGASGTVTQSIDSLKGVYALRFQTQAVPTCAWPGLWAEGMRTSITGGTIVRMSAWTQNGNIPAGKMKAYIVAFNGANCDNWVGESSENMPSQSIWDFFPFPLITYTTPLTATCVKVRINLSQPNWIGDIDEIRLAY